MRDHPDQRTEMVFSRVDFQQVISHKGALSTGSDTILLNEHHDDRQPRDHHDDRPSRDHQAAFIWVVFQLSGTQHGGLSEGRSLNKVVSSEWSFNWAVSPKGGL